MKSLDIPLHVTGRSEFVDDIPVPEGLLYAAVFTSPIAHGIVKKLDVENALKSEGVVGVFTFKDIPGQNQIGGIIQDEPLLAEHHLAFIGEPAAVVVAESRIQAKTAAKKIALDVNPLPPITNPREAFAKGKLIISPRTFAIGDVSNAWKECDVVVEGRVDSGGQEHFYMETQSALVVPRENGELVIYSSTQSPTGVQRIAARVLGLPMHKIEVDVRRLGGGFGGKEDQATTWACLAALAAFKLNRPVKLVLDRRDDMKMTGKRHPYSSDFKIGLKKDGTILAYEVMFFQNSGAAADLSTAILERTLFHTTNSYFIPNVKATAACCYTNLPPFTAFRGFGGPQAMFVIESAIRKAAEELHVPACVLQEKNLLKENDTFPYGMQVENCRARQCWEEAYRQYRIDDIFKDIQTFNASHSLKKKGAALMPICFGISFTSTFLNQAAALVHVYTDGSVNVSTAAVEMGQGVNIKILRVVSRTFSIAPERVKIETTNTGRVANTSPTAASTGSDLNGKAAEIACNQILERLKKTASELITGSNPQDIEIRDEQVLLKGQQTGLAWDKLIAEAYTRRVHLSAHGFYATPAIYFDRSVERGKPFAYHVFGTAVVEVTVDCLRGTYDIDAVRVVHDGGKSIDMPVDRGQVEGGIIQGLGWMTMERLLYSEKGQLLTDNTSTYKIPDIKFTPPVLDIHFLENSDNSKAVSDSKAVGEPPFMYGIGAYFALLNAMQAFKPGKPLFFNSPMTPEKVFQYLYL